MIDQIYDKFLKEMTELHPRDFVWLAFPNEQFEVLSSQLDKELIVRSRQVVSFWPKAFSIKSIKITF